MSRWLVTGADGQLGTDMVAVLTMYGEHVVGAGRDELDVTDRSSVTSAVARARPDVVVNCAAYTAVDAAETDEAAAEAVNAAGPTLLAGAARAVGSRLIHVSTDYVFDGAAAAPYAEDTPVAPSSAYGRTKAAGELAVLDPAIDGFVVRTAWMYGAVGTNFVKTICRLASEQPTVEVVDDQIGSPTWSLHLARALAALGTSSARPGVYHCTNAGEASWHVLARAVFAELGLDPARVVPTSTDRHPRPAPRPRYSVLSNRKWRAAGLPEMPHWRDALHEAFVAVGEDLAGG
jgi:dTDP-4-dehydrorhamnose reductase